MLLHAQRQRLDAAQNQEALEGRQNSAGGFLHQVKTLLVLRLAADKRAAQPVRVAVEKLGGRVHHDVRAQRQRALQHGRHERVVHAHLDAFGVRNLANRADIGKRHQRIGRRFDVHELRRGAYGGGHGLRVARIHVLDLDAVVAHDLIEEPRRPAVHIVRADHVVARVQRGHQRVDGRHAAAKRMAARPALQRRQRLFQPVTRGVSGARVVPAPVRADAGQLKSR